MPVTIVRTTTADPAFVALVRELDADLEARYGEVQKLYTPHNSVEAIATAVLAYDEHDRAVGCGCFKPHDADAIELKRMFVAPAARNQRIGGQLVAALEAWGRELGYTVCVLETGDKQHEAIAMYTRLGFTRMPAFGPYNDLPASVCMRKPLGRNDPRAT